MNYLPDGELHGDQLLLDLFRGEPWGGRSPRALTRGRLGLIFKAQAQTSVSDFVSDENQVDLWPGLSNNPRPIYDGACPLLPLPWEDSKNG